MIKAILAVGRNGELGDTNLKSGLPWGVPIKEDMKYFRDQTLGKTVVMGRKTFNSLPFNDGLPERRNIVLSKEGFYTGKRCLQLRSTFEVLAYAENAESCAGINIYIIGGKSVYEQLFPYCEEVHVTRVNRDYPEADVKINLDFLDTDKYAKLSSTPLNDYCSVEVYKRN